MTNVCSRLDYILIVIERHLFLLESSNIVDLWGTSADASSKVLNVRDVSNVGWPEVPSFLVPCFKMAWARNFLTHRHSLSFADVHAFNLNTFWGLLQGKWQNLFGLRNQLGRQFLNNPCRLHTHKPLSMHLKCDRCCTEAGRKWYPCPSTPSDWRISAGHRHTPFDPFLCTL